MIKKIISVFLFLLLLTFLTGCFSKSPEQEFTELHKIATEMCNDRNGELIFFGKVLTPNGINWNYESVCYKKNENRFYYDFVANAEN